jgi:transcriptional regulator with XRE-family HTH domain
LARRLHRSVSWVQKVEQGARALSDIRLIEELAAVLGVSRRELLGEDIADVGTAMPAEEMQRQAFLQGLGALTLTGEDFSSRDLPYRTDAPLLAALVEGTETLERLYGHITPAALQGLVLGQLEALTALLRGSPGKYRRDVLSLTGETAVLAGWVALDRGKNDRSLFYFDSALRAAADAGDAALSAYAMGSATTVPTFREKSPRSVINALGNGARGVLAANASPSTAAWIATLEASAYATVGERDNALHALARAEDVFRDDEDPAGGRPRVMFFDRGRLAGEQGIIRLELQNTRLDVAGRYLQTALIEIDPRAKIRARFLTALASIHADNGDVEGACRYAADAFRVGLETETVRSLDQVRELRHTKLTRWESHPAVQELDEHLNTLN